jgi:hypothetical protein
VRILYSPLAPNTDDVLATLYAQQESLRQALNQLGCRTTAEPGAVCATVNRHNARAVHSSATGRGWILDRTYKDRLDSTLTWARFVRA